MVKKRVFQLIATAAASMKRCQNTGNKVWADRWAARLTHIERELLPSGSGIDSGTKINWSATGGAEIALNCSFHHMDEHGTYDGWTDHTVRVRPCFEHPGFTIHDITGVNRNEIKEYLADVFIEALDAEAEYHDA